MTSNDASELLLGYGNEILLLVDVVTQDIHAANAAAVRYLGYAQEDLIGRPITDIVCALTDNFYWEDVRHGTLADVHNVETQYRRADGELLDVTKTIIHPASRPDWLVVCAIPTGKLHHTENELANTVARLHATLEATADGILLLDKDGSIVNMNHQFSWIWRISNELLQGGDHHAVFEFMASRTDDPDAYRRRLAEIQPNSDEKTDDLLTLGDGRFLERKSQPAKMGKTIIGRVFSFTDVSEYKAKESRLALAASVFSHAHEGIMITDATGNIVEVNATFCRITGYEREEIIGQNPRFLKSGRQSEDFYREMWSKLATYGHWKGEIWNRRKNGKLYAERLSITAIPDASGASLRYMAILSDITELKEYQRRIEHLAHYDALTGVPNRVLLADRLNLAIVQARRYPRSLILAYLDIDRFKDVNDKYGHETGDQLLITIAHRLRDALREGDTLARLGGDEFVAVITDLDRQAEYKPILDRLLGAAAIPIEIQQNTFQLSASLGVTLFPQDDSNADTLLRHAAQAMYLAKQAGKNRYHLFDPDKELKTLTHHKRLERIAQAIEQNEFELYYQPKVNMRTGVVVGAEALIRWRHPERGLVPPGDFLPLIEGNELMVRLGDWVLDAALRQMTAWYGQGLDIAVSVNIAACHLQQADFLLNLEKKMAAHPTIRHNCLEIEILETAALEGIGRISSLIEGCQAFGVRFSLDDFGTGYSSLTYLRRLPANVLKIDQSFVREMLSDSGDMAIIEGIIGLAAAFGRTVIAEGVETPEHGERLLRLGCELAQGYGIARPMPASELPAWITTWQPPLMWSSVYDVTI
jgi:diguanylate cyclase (GGDEF)-like protein/PAS domain S-box-containing protein